MPREKRKANPAVAAKDDRRVQLKPYTYTRLMKMAEKEDATPTELGNIAVKEYLKKHGFWEDGAAEAEGEK